MVRFQARQENPNINNKKMKKKKRHLKAGFKDVFRALVGVMMNQIKNNDEFA